MSCSLRLFASLIVCLFLFSCTEKKEEAPKNISPQVIKKDTARKDSAFKKDTTAKKDTLAAIPDTGLYRSYLLSGARSLSDLSKEIGESKITIVFKINRR